MEKRFNYLDLATEKRRFLDKLTDQVYVIYLFEDGYTMFQGCGYVCYKNARRALTKESKGHPLERITESNNK